MAVLKELILTLSTLEGMACLDTELILTLSTLGSVWQS